MTLPDDVLVAGAGVSGIGAGLLLQRVGVRCAIVDDNPAGRANAAARGLDTCTSDEARARFDDTGLVLSLIHISEPTRRS